MSTIEHLLKPLQIGKFTLPNRFIMAPLTRTRADEDHVPTDIMVKHYEDRASFGLIIAEATQIREGYSCFGYEPGVYGKPQVEGWRKVTKAVHDKGGLIFLQIHHGGRTTVACNVDDGIKICGPSEGGITGHGCPAAFARDGEKQPYPEKVHALTIPEIKYHVQLFAVAAKNAMAAGFDGVEIHGANSYLIDEFLKDSCNKRTDEYGGSIENRCRFLLEVVDAVAAAIGADRTAVRISPLNGFNDMSDSDPEALTRYICTELSKRKLAFLDVLRLNMYDPATRGAEKWARESYTGVLLSGGAYEIAEAEEALKNGEADAVIFGQKALANPDLVNRAIAGAELNAVNFETLYGRTEVGYNDYPTLRERRLSVIREAEEREEEDDVEAPEAEAEAAAEQEKEASAEADPRFPNLSAEKIQNIKDVFKVIDEDGSGKLDKNEIKVFIDKVGGAACTDEEIDQVVEVYGGGGSEITEEGLLNMFQDQSDGFREECVTRYPNLADVTVYVSVFRRFDKDFSYYIEASELQEMMKTLSGDELSEEDAKAVVETKGEAGKGLSLHAFLSFLDESSRKD